MRTARRHRAFGAMTGWWATAARALALVLALAVAAPVAGLAEDLSYHQGHQGHDRTELAVMSELSADGTQEADPGVGCHVHCGCHIAAPVACTVTPPPAAASRPTYAPASEAVPTIFSDRLPRPPRA